MSRAFLCLFVLLLIWWFPFTYQVIDYSRLLALHLFVSCHLSTLFFVFFFFYESSVEFDLLTEYFQNLGNGSCCRNAGKWEHQGRRRCLNVLTSQCCLHHFPSHQWTLLIPQASFCLTPGVSSLYQLVISEPCSPLSIPPRLTSGTSALSVWQRLFVKPKTNWSRPCWAGLSDLSILPDLLSCTLSTRFGVWNFHLFIKKMYLWFWIEFFICIN